MNEILIAIDNYKEAIIKSVLSQNDVKTALIAQKKALCLSRIGYLIDAFVAEKQVDILKLTLAIIERESAND